MIGILLWASELDRIEDITQGAGLKARFGALPREEHHDAVIRMLCYLKKHLKSRLVYDTEVKDVSDKNVLTMGETFLIHMPKPFGRNRLKSWPSATHPTWTAKSNQADYRYSYLRKWNNRTMIFETTEHCREFGLRVGVRRHAHHY